MTDLPMPGHSWHGREMQSGGGFNATTRTSAPVQGRRGKRNNTCFDKCNETVTIRLQISDEPLIKHTPMNTPSLMLACAAALICSAVLASSTSSPNATARVVKVVKVAGMDKAPVVLKSIIPDYPIELREVGIQGIATVDMLIDSTGRVISTELVNTTVPELGRLAMAAAKDWTFVPASAKGKPITTRVRVPFEFVMPELVALGRR